MRATGLLSVLPAVNVHSNEQPGGDFKTCKILQQHFNTRRRVFDLKCNVEQGNGFKVSFLLNIFMCFLALRLKRSRWVCDYLPLASALTHLHFERDGVCLGWERPPLPPSVWSSQAMRCRSRRHRLRFRSQIISQQRAEEDTYSSPPPLTSVWLRPPQTHKTLQQGSGHLQHHCD